jgi:hydrogenase expression/formation protein HypD
MRYLDEYRDPTVVTRLVDRIARAVTRPWVVMEICGGQTHAIVRYGLDRLLPPTVELVHGPGCPVCVTSLETIDRAHAIASEPNVIFTSFGDMLRVPGSHDDLLALKARGADVRVVYSPLDAVAIARQNPGRRVVFFGIGFETTTPANAMALREAKRLGVTNFSMLGSHVLVPPAIEAILTAPDNRVQGFLGPAHVCTITGYRAYEDLARRHHTPIVVTGFEPVDLLEGVAMTVEQLEAGRSEVENQYVRGVRRDPPAPIAALVDEVFEVSDRAWRGIGTIPKSGLRIRDEYAAHDAERVFDVGDIVTRESTSCIAGEVLRGKKKPCDCPAFGKGCTPATPLGATMVSSEGACAAYFANGRHKNSLGGPHVR